MWPGLDELALAAALAWPLAQLLVELLWPDDA